MKKIYFFLTLFVIFHENYAQYRVEGTVSGMNQIPISFAAVGLHSLQDSVLVKGAITDENGVFQISDLIEGAYYISIQYVGYKKMKSKQFDVDELHQTVNLGSLILEEDVQTLAEVTIAAQRQLVEQQPDRIVLNVENSVIAKGNKVNDLLRYAPMVQLDHEGGIKVGNTSSVLILVDGRQMGSSALNSFLQNFSAENILKVEVITNPSSRYDASYKSVINIVTKSSQETGLNGRFSLNYSKGEADRFAPDASLNYRSKRWNLFGGASYHNSDYAYDQRLERFFPESRMNNDIEGVNHYNKVATFMGVDFFPADRHILGMHFNGNWSNIEGDNNTFTSFFHPDGSLDYQMNTDNLMNTENETYDINLNYTGKFDSTGREIVVNVTQTFYDQEKVQNLNYKQVGPPESEGSTPTLLRITNPSLQSSFIAQADYTIPVNNSTWAVGAKYVSVSNDNNVNQENLINGTYEIDPSFTNEDRYKEKTSAAYASYSRIFKDDWQMHSSLRAEWTEQALTNDNISRNYFGLFPSAGISKKFGNDNTWSLSYSRKIYRPDLGSLVPYKYMADPYTLKEGNPYLKPQFSHTFEIYINLTGLSLFANYSITRDLIAHVLYGDANTKVYTQKTSNLEHVQEGYLGFNWSSAISPWWQTNTTVTFLGTEISSSVAEVSDLSLSGYGINLQTTNLFNLPYNWKAELLLNYNSPNRSIMWKTKAVYWASAGLSKQLFDNLNFRLQMQDIFRTHKYRLLVKYGAIDLYSTGYNDNQRFVVSLSYNFGKKTVKQARERSLGNEESKSRLGGD